MNIAFTRVEYRILLLLLIFADAVGELTNSMAYGTRRLNIAFTRVEYSILLVLLIFADAVGELTN